MREHASRQLVALVVLASFITAACAEPPSIAEQINIDQWLLLPKVGHGGRVPFPSNPITYSIVTGTFQPPHAGDTVPNGSDKPAVWTEVAAPAKGPLKHEFLRGGWAYATVHVDQPRRAILRAKGHSIAYINSEPRVTNVYRSNYVMIPILLKAGDNSLLFRCTRYGTLEARLEPVTHDLMINIEDATLPEAPRGDTQAFDAGIVVINTTTQPLDVADAQGAAGDSVALPSYWMPPLSIAKLPVRLPARPAEGDELVYRLFGERVQPAEIKIPIVEPDAFRKVTFISDVEGSVQYFGYRPRRRPNDGRPPALMLHLHGAGDEAANYRNIYYAKPWCVMASATNRRPFGFDWEGCGRIDAMEVLARATALAQPDPARIYLGGHSMGGHGVWQVGGHFPDRFAAIGVGAGWQDFWTYTGSGRTYEDPTDIQKILDASDNPSRTALLVNNYLQQGVVIIHGDADNVVPIREAYGMRDLLKAAGHDDVTMVIEPGAGHVFDATPEVGKSCFDSREMFDFFQRHARPFVSQRVDFTTISPGINDSCQWVRIEQQVRRLRPSRAQLQIDPGRRWLFGSLENVRRFSADPARLIEPGELTIQFDQDEQRKIEWSGGELHFVRSDDGWQVAHPLDPAEMGPHRSGPFKTVFLHNHPILVVGTRGSPEENTWALAKARFDNETMWYRGNGSFEIVLDTDFDPAADPDRNVVLYGNADTNAAWRQLLGDCPIQARRGEISIGGRRLSGDDLACLMIRPRPGSQRACVGAVGGSGVTGMRATDELAFFFAGVHYPDFVVFGADVWKSSDAAVRAAGFFGNDWSLDAGEVAFAE